MNVREIKKYVPDVCTQNITLTTYASRDEFEKKAKEVAEMMGTGLIGFDYNGKNLKVYTSYAFKSFLDLLKPGYVLTAANCRLEREFKIESTPHISGTEMAVRANNDLWWCWTLYNKYVDYSNLK